MDGAGLLSGFTYMLLSLYGGGPHSLESSLETGPTSTSSSQDTVQASEEQSHLTHKLSILEIKPRFTISRVNSNYLLY